MRRRALFLWRQEDTSSLRLFSVDSSGQQQLNCLISRCINTYIYTHIFNYICISESQMVMLTTTALQVKIYQIFTFDLIVCNWRRGKANPNHKAKNFNFRAPKWLLPLFWTFTWTKRCLNEMKNIVSDGMNEQEHAWVIGWMSESLCDQVSVWVMKLLREWWILSEW